jgi:hypothetical protein
VAVNGWPAARCGGRRGFFLAVGGGKRTSAVGVAAPTMKKEEKRA